MNISLPAHEDPLGEAFRSLRIAGTLYCQSEFTAPWALEVPSLDGYLMFHFVTHGECWLDMPNAKRRLLQTGDLILLPHGKGHRLSSGTHARVANLFEIDREQISERYEVLRLGEGGMSTNVICGVAQFDHPSAHTLIKLLPPVIVIQSCASHDTDSMQNTFRLLASEAKDLKPGAEAIIIRLADILVIQTLRLWIEQDPAMQNGSIGALRNKHIGQAISLIHRHPDRTWTVASLAQSVAMSRSAFSARFTELIGEPPRHYITRSKMHRALIWLKEEDATIADLADRLGYQSEAAFSRAFKRFIGTSPGTMRNQQTIDPPTKASQRPHL